MSHWRYFRLEEFACPCGCGRADMDLEFISDLDELRHRLGFRLVVSSGFRCEEYDASIGGAGVHPQGKAANFPIAGDQQDAFLEEAYAIRCETQKRAFCGIGINGKGPWAKRFGHLDNLQGGDHPRPRTWTY